MSDNFEIRPLARVPAEEILSAFLRAFGDYNIKFSAVGVEAMLRRRGADLALSFGAFHNGTIASFVLNGIGEFGGVPTAYDTGTGTIGEFRGLGLTDRILGHAMPVLHDAGVRQYLLEVLQDNVPAVKIYTRQGFSITREFHCYAAKAADVIAKGSSDVRLCRATVEEIGGMQRMADFLPSWQNSMDSILRASGAFDCIAAYDGDEPVGFGVTEKAYGDLTQIAVAPEYRGRGIGTQLLSALSAMSSTGSVKVVNVDASCKSLNGFLIHKGFLRTCSQYEMIKPV